MTEGEFEILFHTYNRLIISFARNIIGETYAEDVAANVFLKAWKESSVTKTWLCVVAANECKNHLRQLRRANLANKKIFCDEQVEASWIKAELIELILSKIKMLAPVQRKVFTLWYRDDLSASEISGLLHININTVRVHLMRAKNKIIPLIESEI